MTLLGTGSPSPSATRHHPAALVQWGERSSMLVDAGDGVVNQMLSAGLQLADLEQVAITHLHWDHILGYPALVWGSWCLGRSRLRVVGPIGTADMHQRLVEDYYRAQAEWAIDLGFQRAGWDDIEVLDVEAGWLIERDGCAIEAGRVVHPPMAALAYRFTAGGRSLVISGDTARCDELVEFARGADLLVVDACAAPPTVDVTPARRAIIDRLHAFHASPQDCIDMAAAAGVAQVVLTHHLPEATPEFDVNGYAGEVLVGDDLDVVIARSTGTRVPTTTRRSEQRQDSRASAQRQLTAAHIERRGAGVDLRTSSPASQSTSFFRVTQFISEGDSMASIDVNGTAVLPAGDALGDARGRVMTRLDGLQVQR